MIPALMVAFAVLDLAFAGFRAAAGRDGLIEKRAYYTRAMGEGAGLGLAFSAVMALVTWAVVRRAEDPGALFAELVATGSRMLLVFGGYAVLVLAALIVYTIAKHELRTLATVAILGPFTLIRPWVIACAAAFGLGGPRPLAVSGLTLVSCAGVVVLAMALDAAYGDASPLLYDRPIPPWQRALEVGRPLALLALFLVLTYGFGWRGGPFALVVVFAFAILVHDLIHNALHLPKPWDRVVLSVFAQFLLKSGHALRTTHVRHHQLCLKNDDEEGRLVHASALRLVILGPWLAVRARWVAFREGQGSRAVQVFETAVNLTLSAALVWAAYHGSTAALAYLASVIFVTFTSPIWGAQIPHRLPGNHPIAEWLKRHIGRLTPAACSVLFHELHHRSPRVPVSLLARHQARIAAMPPSPCEDPLVSAEFPRERASQVRSEKR
ncbi:MAG: fatty acid desaturase [Polyangiaceae bacterium]|nr:fatty acid desaturase [Polyangiaceae bacterium]